MLNKMIAEYEIKNQITTKSNTDDIFPTKTELVDDYFFQSSKCAADIKLRTYLFSLFEYKKVKTILLYRASLNGWYPANFHQRCDNRGATVCLFKIKDGDCIGGYTKAKWTSPSKWISSGEWIRDDDAMVFNLTA